jgi:hypothetical protein
MAETTLTIVKRIDENVKAILKLLTPPIPTPISKYVMLNCINWNSGALNVLPLQDASEFTYFVLLVGQDGTLEGGSTTQETKFVLDVHGANKKATFSIGGGTQNITNITNAINQKTNLINNIKSRITQFGYDGVTLDIENTSIDPQKLVDFINALRLAIPDKIIGCYTQPYQLATVFSKIEQASNSLTWLAPMIYDFSYTINELTSLTNAWATKIPKDKLLCGVAVNYATGLDEAKFSQVLDIVIAQGWKGIGIWENTLYTQPYINIKRSKI